MLQVNAISLKSIHYPYSTGTEFLTGVAALRSNKDGTRGGDDKSTNDPFICDFWYQWAISAFYRRVSLLSKPVTRGTHILHLQCHSLINDSPRPGHDYVKYT